MSSIVQRHSVCTECMAVGIVDKDCICLYGEVDYVELEFDVCKCCDSILNDGSPRDTEFNKMQFKKLER